MNSDVRPARPLPPPAGPMDYVVRRLSSLAVAGGAITAFLTASLLESAGFPAPVAAGSGFIAFVAATAFATDLSAARRMSRLGNGPR